MKRLFAVAAGLAILFSLGAGSASADANERANERAKLLSSGNAVTITTPTGIVIFSGSTLRGTNHQRLGSKRQTPTHPVKPSKPTTPTTFTEPAPPAPPAPTEPIPM